MPDVTLVITRSGDVAAGVRRVLGRWMQAGLVRSFLWWHGRSAAGHVVCAGDDPLTRPMLEAIGSDAYQTVRLIALTVAADADADVGLGAVAVDIEEAIAAKLGEGQRLARVNLIVPASGIRGLPPELLNSRWDVNLVVADEDRPTPLLTSPDIQDTDRLTSHTAAALATVAGLWPGMPGGPFDNLYEGGQQDARIRVVRSYLRLVRCDRLVDGVTRQILDLQENRQWLADGVGALPAADPNPIIAGALDQFLAGAGARLTRQPAVSRPPMPPRTLTPMAAFRELWRFLAAAGRRAPADIAGYVKDRTLMRLEEFAQDVVFGNDSTAQVKIGSRTLLAERDNGERVSAGAAEFAEALLGWLGKHPPVPALAQEWRGMRSLAFGLVDAATLPDGVDEPRERSRRLVVMDIDLVVPDPHQPPESGVAPCDPAGAAHVASELAADKPERERFDGWLAERGRSLLWRIGERITADAAAAETALVDALASLARPHEEATVDRRETSRMYAALILIAVLAAAVVVSGIALWIKDIVSARAAAVIAAAGLIGWLALSWSVFYPYVRRQFRLANALLKRFNEDNAARLDAEWEAGELLRLGAAYREYLDWTVIIGSVLHRPGGEVAVEPAEADITDLGLPDAIGLAVAETDVPRRCRLAAIVGRRHFHRGWASGLLVEFTASSMAALKFEKGGAEDDPDPEPDVDPRARERLRVDLTSGCARVFGRRIRTDVARTVGHQPLGELFSALQPSREPSADGFLTAIWAQPPTAPTESFSWPLWQVGRVPIEDDRFAWKPPAVAASWDAHVVDVPPVIHDDGTVRLMWTGRLDVSGAGRWTDLTIFEVPEPAIAEITGASLDGIG